MADRDMSYELDGVFSTRNAGELVSAERPKMKIVRNSGLKRLGTPLGTPKTTRLLPTPYTNLNHSLGTKMGTPRTTSLDPAMSHPATGLADAYSPMAGLGLDVPFLGTISWQQIAVGAAVGMALMALLRRR